MTEKQFYDWHTVGSTDDVMRFAKEKGTDLIWSIARDGDGFLFRVVTLEETLLEKVRAWSDRTRVQSKRLKDFADIADLVESHPELWRSLPDELKEQIEAPSAVE